MFTDPVAGADREGADELIQVIALEESDAAATLAEEHVLMSMTGGNEGLAALRLVDALDEVQLLQFLERAVDGDQAEGVICLASPVIDLEWGEGAGAPGDSLDNGASGLRQAISVGMQLSEPLLSGHGMGESVIQDC